MECGRRRDGRWGEVHAAHKMWRQRRCDYVEELGRHERRGRRVYRCGVGVRLGGLKIRLVPHVVVHTDCHNAPAALAVRKTCDHQAAAACIARFGE
jgi:hypothetical protein